MDTFLNTHDLAKLNKMNINSLKFIIKNELKAVINNLLTLKKNTRAGWFQCSILLDPWFSNCKKKDEECLQIYSTTPILILYKTRTNVFDENNQNKTKTLTKQQILFLLLKILIYTL